MTHTIVLFDIRCAKVSNELNPVYRIFIKDTLVVERPFWPKSPDYYINEQLTMTNDGKLYNIHVKNVFPDRGDVFIHDIKFVNGNDMSPVDIKHMMLNNNAFTFTLPKR